jgi:hypothetical protein
MNLTPEQMSDPKIRIDLKIGTLIQQGKISHITLNGALTFTGDPISFRVGDTHIWGASMKGVVGYQVADKVDGYFKNHRGEYKALIPSLNAVLAEQGYDPLPEDLLS